MFLRSFLNAFRMHKVAKLTNSGRHEEAVRLLERIRGMPRENAWRILMIADVQLRGGKLDEARLHYERFIRGEFHAIKNAADRNYLLAYAGFFLSEIARRKRESLSEVVSLDEVRFLSKKASTLVRADFVPP